jgi:hypothetical protein
MHADSMRVRFQLTLQVSARSASELTITNLGHAARVPPRRVATRAPPSQGATRSNECHMHETRTGPQAPN